MIDTVINTGTIRIELRDEFGDLKQEIDTKNLVVESGKQLIARRLAGQVTGTSAAVSHIAIGTGNTTPDPLNTALVTEVSRVAFLSNVTTLNTTAYTVTFGAGIPASGSYDIKEAGIFNASSAGVMLNRAVFPTVIKNSSDTLTITWNVKQN